MAARYQLDYKTIPACCCEHGFLIKELSALHVLWQGCFKEDAVLSDRITFHREFEAALRGLRERNSRLGSTRTVHRPDIEA